MLRARSPAVEDGELRPGSHVRAGSVALPERLPRTQWRAQRGLPADLTAMIGAGGLLAVVLASAYLALGAAGGLYLLELPSSADPGWIRGPLRSIAGDSQWLQSSQLSAGLIVLVLGYLLALACARAVSLRLAVAAVLAANLAFTLGPTIVSTDVFGYIAYARELALHGLDPYVSPPRSLGHDGILAFVYWKHQPSPYGPLFTFFSAPLGLVSGTVALWTFKALAGAASVATALMLAALARDRGRDPARVAIFVGLNPAVLFYAVSGAHNDLLAVSLVVLGVTLVLRGRSAAGAGAAVAGAAIKLTVGLAIPFLVIAARRRGRALSGGALVAAALGVPALILFGAHFFDQLQRIASDPLFDTLFSGPDRLAAALGTHITPAIRTLCTAAAGGVAVIALLWAWRGGDALTAAGWAFLALIVSIASLAPWYLAWLLPFAAIGRSRALRLLTLLLTLYVMAVHLPLLGGLPWLSQAPGSAARTRTIALRAPGVAHRAGESSSTLPAPTTGISPLTGSTATMSGRGAIWESPSV